MKLSSSDIRARFKKKGLKVTPQRSAIYQALAETTSHPTAEILFSHVKETFPTMSLNTVYYTLSVLCRSNLAKEVNYWHDRARYDANVHPHHHLICVGCRTIQDLKDSELDTISSPHIPKNFSVLGHQVEFHGYCATCQKRRPHADESIISHNNN
jgi:Fur family peroxide stress response transcriptional regulator